jgi:hypothetical protein
LSLSPTSLPFTAVIFTSCLSVCDASAVYVRFFTPSIPPPSFGPLIVQARYHILFY